MHGLIILDNKLPQKYLVYDRFEGKTWTYDKSWLKHLYQSRLVDLQNPEKLFSFKIRKSA